MLFRRCQNKEKGTGSYDQKGDRPFWLKKGGELSSTVIPMSGKVPYDREEGCVCIYGGRGQDPTFLCHTPPLTFCPQHPPGEWGEEGKAQSCRRTEKTPIPSTGVYMSNRYFLVLFKFHLQNTVRNQFLPQLQLPPGKEYSWLALVQVGLLSLLFMAGRWRIERPACKAKENY